MSNNAEAATTTSDQYLRRAMAREAEILGSGPRIEPLVMTEISPSLLAILDRMENVNDVLKSNAEGDRGGTQSWREQVLANPAAAALSPEIMASINRLPEIFGTMMRHAELFAKHTDVGLQLLARGVLSVRDREFAVLRIAWLCQAPYEWGEHVLVGRRFGLSGEDFARIVAGPESAGLTEHERAILRAVDELHGDAMIADATWSILARELNEQQLIELPIIVGQYQSVAYYQNSLRLRLHTGNLGLKAR
jgi:alkylhydroperoxidase family enzyme